MTEEKNTRSELFKENYGRAYGEALKQVDLLNKRFIMAMQVMDTVDAKMGDIDQQTKEIVRYEMAVRFGLEKHKVLDIEFSQISSVLDKKGSNGKAIPCPDCSDGKVGEHRCKSCGGVGKMVSHDLSLSYKLLYGIGDLTRIMQMQGGVGGDVGGPGDVMEMAYEQMMNSGLEGEDAKEALGLVASQLGLEKKDAIEFVNGYEDYVKAKKEESSN